MLTAFKNQAKTPSHFEGCVQGGGLALKKWGAIGHWAKHEHGTRYKEI